mmetsp:Transcript_5847/g.16954  ORF Transcript_5847/g.16954 Transcript_5847/m.16954 type:complete len:220 (-) Transcript_5847:593-1252(-)
MSCRRSTPASSPRSSSARRRRSRGTGSVAAPSSASCSTRAPRVGRAPAPGLCFLRCSRSPGGLCTTSSASSSSRRLCNEACPSIGSSPSAPLATTSCRMRATSTRAFLCSAPCTWTTKRLGSTAWSTFSCDTGRRCSLSCVISMGCMWSRSFCRPRCTRRGRGRHCCPWQGSCSAGSRARSCWRASSSHRRRRGGLRLYKAYGLRVHGSSGGSAAPVPR